MHFYGDALSRSSFKNVLCTLQIIQTDPLLQQSIQKPPIRYAQMLLVWEHFYPNKKNTQITKANVQKYTQYYLKVVRDHQGYNRRSAKICQKNYGKRKYNRQRNGPLRIFHFFTCRCNTIKTDKAIEASGCSFYHSFYTERKKTTFSYATICTVSRNFPVVYVGCNIIFRIGYSKQFQNLPFSDPAIITYRTTKIFSTVKMLLARLLSFMPKANPTTSKNRTVYLTIFNVPRNNTIFCIAYQKVLLQFQRKENQNKVT